MEMTLVKGRRRNMVSVGWDNFTLEIQFYGGRRYQYGGVPLEVKDKLLRSPYPDHLFNQIVRNKYLSKRVDFLPPSKPVPTIDLESLPF